MLLVIFSISSFHSTQKSCQSRHILEQVVTVTTKHAHRNKSKEHKMKRKRNYWPSVLFPEAFLPVSVGSYEIGFSFPGNISLRNCGHWIFDTRLSHTNVVLEPQSTCQPSLLVRNSNFFWVSTKGFDPLAGPQSRMSKIRIRLSLGICIFYITAKFHIHRSTDKGEESIWRILQNELRKWVLESVSRTKNTSCWRGSLRRLSTRLSV